MNNGESLSQSTNRVVLREENLIYAPEFIFRLDLRRPGFDFSPIFCFRYVTSQTFARSSARFLHLFQMDGQSWAIHLGLRPFWMFRIDKPGTFHQNL
jgi:hypothetical protein